MVFERDAWRCVMCGRPGALECDHVTPLQREPGQDVWDMNGLQTLCRGCHIEKTRHENLTRPRSPQAQAWQALCDELRALYVTLYHCYYQGLPKHARRSE